MQPPSASQVSPGHRTLQSRVRSRFFSVAFSATLGLLLPGCATTQLPDAGTVDFDDVEFSLRQMDYPSGLRIVVEHDPDTEYVTVATVVGVGGAEDPEHLPGLAHVIEHMAFRSRPTGEATVAEQLQWLGAEHNASTGLDLTTYFTSAPAPALRALLELEAYRLFSPLAGSSEQDFAIEREVVVNELRQRNESGLISDVLGALQEAVFSEDHPYRRSIGGDEASLNRMTIDAAIDFAQTHYQPDNTTIVISGKVDLNTADALIQATFPPELLAAQARPKSASGPRALKAETLPEPSTAGAEQPIRVRAAVDEHELWIGWSIPGESSGIELLLPYITGLLRMNLNRAISNDEHVLSVSVQPVIAQRASMILARIQVAGGDMVEPTSRQALDKLHELGDLVGDNVPGLLRETVAAESRRGAVVSWLVESEHPTTRTLLRARELHLRNDASVLARRAEDIGKIDPVQAFEFAHSYLTRSRARFVHAVPQLVALERDQGRSVRFRHSAHHELRAPQEDSEVAVLPPLRAQSMVSRTLDNGLQVVLLAHGDHPTVHARLTMPGGAAAGKTAMTSTLAGLFYERNRRQHGSLSGAYGGFDTFADRLDEVLYIATAASGNVGNLVAIAAEKVRFPALYSQVASDYRRSGRLQRVLKKFEDPEFKADVAARRHLFEDHVYGRSVDVEDLTKFKLTELSRWQKQVFQPAGATLTIVGAIDPKEVLSHVTQYFGAWKNSASKDPWTPPPLAEPAAQSDELPRIKAHNPTLTQDRITVVCRMHTESLEQLAAVSVLASGLEDRLGRQLREAWGSSYGVSASSAWYAGGVSTLQLGFAVDAEQYEDALGEAQALLSEDQGLGDAEQLQWARWRAATELRHRMRSSPGLARIISRLVSLGYPPRAFLQLPDVTLNANSDTVNRMFEKCQASALIKVVGPDGK